jgi:hypothetical protein
MDTTTEGSVMMVTEYPERTVYDPASDTAYVPFVSDDGRVGYRVIDTRAGKAGERETFLYFNPSISEGGGDDPNVFVYIGGENDPAHDESLHFYAPWEGIA